MKQRLKPRNPVTVPRASDWVPPEERDTGWWLFNQLFHCRVQRIQTVSIDEMKDYGTPTSGDPEFDAQMRNERIDRMLTIKQMMEYWDQGVTVGVVSEKDTKSIYELITNHLLAWKRHLEVEINVRGAPLDDLIKLDAFANIVYKHARFHFTKEYVDSILGRKIEAIPHARDNVIKPFSEVVRINADERAQSPEDAQKKLEEQYPDRVSLSDAFQRGQRNGGVNPGFSWRR
jgi:hypothetical protein